MTELPLTLEGKIDLMLEELQEIFEMLNRLDPLLTIFENPPPMLAPFMPVPNGG